MQIIITLHDISSQAQDCQTRFAQQNLRSDICNGKPYFYCFFFFFLLMDTELINVPCLKRKCLLVSN